MASWQRHARLIIAVGGVVFAIVVARAFRPRAPEASPTVVERSDPSAVVETVGGRTLRFNRDKEEISIEHERQMTTADGSTRLAGVTVTSVRGDRTYVLKSDTALVSDKESNLLLEGHVVLTANDGLQMTGDRATFNQDEGVVRVPGPVQFSRGRTSGTSVGMTYDKNQDVVVLLDQAVVTMASAGGPTGPQASSAPDGGAMTVTAGSAELRRLERVIRFDRALQVVRDRRTMTAATGVARLAEDGETLQVLELRGGSRVQDAPTGPGSLETMTAVDMDLRYAADGSTLEYALLAGDATVHVSGQPAQGSRRITSNVMDITLGDGVALKALVAREGVQLHIPAEAGGATRTVTSQVLEAAGEGKQGLRTAHFTGNVQFRERGPTIDRAARSGLLDLNMEPGLGAIEDARFSRAVRFEEAKMAADAAAARYVLGKGALALSGSEPGREKPHVVHDRFGVYATSIDITLEGPDVNASGDVKSVIQPAKDGGESGDAKLPSMLKRDQIVNVTAGELRYEASTSKATYTRNALLWQGETSIKADTIVVDDRNGDLTGQGKVATSMMLEQGNDKGEKERIRSTTTAKDFQYEEQSRKATYAGDAHMNSARGDMTAAKIELFLKPAGDQLDRAEAYEAVTLQEKSRKTTGARLTYYSADERYIVTGAPVTVVDECSRETTGRTLTFFRTADRIVVDGSERIRTQTKGNSQCPGP
jgi:LPS export ABC transporter protein LptC